MSMSRDDFIAAMIGELSKQKAHQGNTDAFFTGQSLTASQVFRKMSFDFPVVDDQALQVLLVGLKTMRVSNKPHELRSEFHLNRAFVDNLFSLAEAAHGPERERATERDVDSDDDEDGNGAGVTLQFDAAKRDGERERERERAAPSKRSAVLSALHCEVFLHLPLSLAALNRYELAARLSPRPSSSDRERESVAWRDVLAAYRDLVLRGAASAIGAHCDAKTLCAADGSGAVDALLALIRALQRIVDRSARERARDRETERERAMPRHNAHLSLFEWLDEQRRESERETESERESEAEQALAMAREVFAHAVRLATDLSLRHAAALLGSHFPLLLDTLLQREIETERDAGDALFYGAAVRARATDALFPLPSLSKRLALAALSDVSLYLSAERDRDRDREREREQSARESLRRALLEKDSLSRLHDLFEALAKHNKHRREREIQRERELEKEKERESGAERVPQREREVSSAIVAQRVIDIESATRLVDVAELVLLADISPHNTLLQRTITEKLLSSRMLASLMTLYRNALFVYSQHPVIALSANSDIAANPGAAQIWSLCTRLTRVLSSVCLLDAQLASFVADFPEVFTAFPALFSPVARRPFSLWCPALAIPLVFSAALTLNTKGLSLQPVVGPALHWLQAAVSETDFSCAAKAENDENAAVQDDQETTSVVVAAPPNDAAQSLRRQDRARLLESILLLTKCLSREEVRADMNRVEIDAKRAADRMDLYRSLRMCLSAVYRKVNAARGTVSESALQSLLDKTTKALKTVLSMLEGGVSSKAD